MLFNMFPVHSGGCSINADTTFFNVLELVPELNVARLDLVELFGRHAPLQVDLGCGDGSFLCELAGQFPEKNFLGIERLTKRVEKVRRKMLKIENVRVLGTQNGALRIATDQLDYFHQMEQLSRGHSQFEIVPSSWNDCVLPRTKFESRFRQQGVPIYRLTLRKISPVK